MTDELAPVRSTFRERVRAPAWWFAILLEANRTGVTVALAATGPLLVVLALLVGPVHLADTVTDPQHVQEAFSRLASVVATASAIAVSVTTLSLRRELKGVRGQRRHQEANLDLRERVRAHADQASAPLQASSFVATALAAITRSTRKTRKAARESGVLDERVDGVRLADYLDAVDAAATRGRGLLRDVRERPGAFLPAVLDFEHEVTLHYARAFKRADGTPGSVQDALGDLESRVEDLVVAKWYAQTLDTQWGLGGMSFSILVSTIPAVLVSLGMVLAYGDGVVSAWGARAAGFLVAGALAVAMLPLAAFVSHLLRFVFVNRLTLVTSGFVLGPEEPEAVDVGRPREEEV